MQNARILVDILKEKKYTISFAESATGGLLASSIVDIPDASWVLAESLVTYSNEAKMKYLDVKKETIDKYNVVSIEVVKEMAIGLHKLTNSNVCVSVSGVAGPSGGTKEIPVGTICIGFYINGYEYQVKEVFSGTRNEVRIKTKEYIFKTLIDLLGENNGKRF
jgi:PncC family amidohydrolase